MAQAKKKKRYETEWSFSFEGVANKISGMFDSVGVNSSAEAQHASYSEPLGASESAHVVLKPSIGTTVVDALRDSEDLIQADLTYLGEVDFEVSGEAEKTVKLKQRKHEVSISNIKQQLLWDIGLSPEIPIDLSFKGGVGKTDLQLDGLQLMGLSVQVGVGKVALSLPATEESYDVEIEGGVGKLDIELADNAAVYLKINSGVGQTSIALPEEAAVRIKANNGIGSIDIAAHVEHVKHYSKRFFGKDGVWETPGFADAERQIIIKYEGGVGGLRVR